MSSDHTSPLRVLLVDDDKEEFLILKDLLGAQPTEAGYPLIQLDWLPAYEAGLQALEAKSHDVYLIDYRLGERSGIDLLREAKNKGINAPMIILTGKGSYQVDLTAMQLGAADYLVKGHLSPPLLERAIRYALERTNIQNRLEELVKELRQRSDELSALHAATATLLTTIQLDELFSQILNAAQSALPAGEQAWLHLISQETGELELCAVRGASDLELNPVEFPEDENFPKRVFQEARPMLVNDVKVDRGRPGRKAPGKAWARSMIAVPLIANDHPIGVLSLGAPHPLAFSEPNLHMLVRFAATTTAAIQNAVLFKNMEKIATTDPLTEQLNRRAFLELGQREFERHRRLGQPLSALMIDLDHFKTINDLHGHPIGDQVLRGIVDRCCERIRKIDILGRFGGDEFAVLLPRADGQTASEIAERVRSAICDTHIDTDAGPIQTSVSIGVSEATPDTNEITTLLSRADAALYEAKHSGRNRVLSK